MNSLNMAFRVGNPNDLNFILDSWLKDYKPVSELRGKTYYLYHKPVVVNLLSRSYCLVACDPEDPNHIYGYAVFEKVGPVLVLHWIHVKRIYRMLGIARRLFGLAMNDGGSLVVTHLGAMADKFDGKVSYLYKPELAHKVITYEDFK